MSRKNRSNVLSCLALAVSLLFADVAHARVPFVADEVDGPDVTSAPSRALVALPRVAQRTPAESLSVGKPAPTTIVAPHRKMTEPTWSQLNQGFFVTGSLIGHIGSASTGSGIGKQIDFGYQFGFGLGLIAHLDYTYLVASEGTSASYVAAGAGLRFAAPLRSWLRLWIQGSYGVAGYSVEDADTGAVLASSGLGKSLALRGGIDFRLSSSIKGDHVFVGVSGGVDVNRFANEDDVFIDVAKKIAVSVTWVH